MSAGRRDRHLASTDRHRRTAGVRRTALRLLLSCACLAAVACSERAITTVDVGSVTISPPRVSALEGQRVPLTAAVREPSGALLEGATVAWASDDPGVASFEGDGTMVARAEGSTRVTASFRGVSGEAMVEVLAGPSIQLSHQEVALYGGSGGAAPRDFVVYVTNGGAASLGGLTAAVTYPAGAAAGWLEAELASPEAPTELTLTARSEGLSVGSYAATVTLTADVASNGPVDLPVTLTLTAFSVLESGGGTTVSESGGSDTLEVALHSAPTSDVVLELSPTDAGELAVSPTRVTFTPADWRTRRTVTLTGVDDDVVDGDRTTHVDVSVDAASSDDAFDGVPPHRVSVVTTDDDVARLEVVQSGNVTSVYEDGDTDDFSVLLSARPLSEVVVEMVASDAGEIDVSPTTLTFAPSAWNKPRTVTVTGLDDGVADGARSVSVRVVVVDPSSDDAFDDAPDVTVPVTVMDGDRADLDVDETDGGTTVTEALGLGRSDEVLVALTRAPASNVVVAVASANPLEVLVTSVPMLVFTPSNWSQPQSVTVTAVNDLLPDGDRITQLTLAVVDLESDAAFEGLMRVVDVRSIDDDLLPIGAAVDRPGASLLHPPHGDPGRFETPREGHAQRLSSERAGVHALRGPDR